MVGSGITILVEIRLWGTNIELGRHYCFLCWCSTKSEHFIKGLFKNTFSWRALEGVVLGGPRRVVTRTDEDEDDGCLVVRDLDAL
jgi:hypothetical protein